MQPGGIDPVKTLGIIILNAPIAGSAEATRDTNCKLSFSGTKIHSPALASCWRQGLGWACQDPFSGIL